MTVKYHNSGEVFGEPVSIKNRILLIFLASNNKCNCTYICYWTQEKTRYETVHYHNHIYYRL